MSLTYVTKKRILRVNILLIEITFIEKAYFAFKARNEHAISERRTVKLEGNLNERPCSPKIKENIHRWKISRL